MLWGATASFQVPPSHSHYTFIELDYSCFYQFCLLFLEMLLSLYGMF